MSFVSLQPTDQSMITASKKLLIIVDQLVAVYDSFYNPELHAFSPLISYLQFNDSSSLPGSLE